MSVVDYLSQKVRERTALISQATSILWSDERVVAAWLAGSLGRGDADAYSDIDLWVVVRDEDMDSVREARQQFVEVLGRPVLISEAPQNAPPGGAYLWTFYPGEYGPQHVDWSWLPQSTAHIPADAQVLFDKAGLAPSQESLRKPPEGEELGAALTQECAFFWGMCGVVAKYIARGRRYNVLNLLNLVAHTSDKIEWLLGEGELKSYNASVWDEVPLFTEPVDQLGLLRKMATEMEWDTGPKIEAAGGQVPHEAIAEVHNFFDLVASDLESPMSKRSMADTPEDSRTSLVYSVEDITIRPLQGAQEVETCARMMSESEPWKTLGRDYSASVAIVSDPSKEVYVAVQDEDITGFVIINMQGAFVGYIQTLCVAPEVRGQGIGSLLLRFAEERIFRDSPNVFMCVSSFNKGAQRLYARLGYQLVGELTNYIVAGHSEILLRKTIGPISGFRSVQSELAEQS